MFASPFGALESITVFVIVVSDEENEKLSQGLEYAGPVFYAPKVQCRRALHTTSFTPLFTLLAQ